LFNPRRVPSMLTDRDYAARRAAIITAIARARSELGVALNALNEGDENQQATVRRLRDEIDVLQVQLDDVSLARDAAETAREARISAAAKEEHTAAAADAIEQLEVLASLGGDIETAIRQLEALVRRFAAADTSWRLSVMRLCDPRQQHRLSIIGMLDHEIEDLRKGVEDGVPKAYGFAALTRGRVDKLVHAIPEVLGLRPVPAVPEAADAPPVDAVEFRNKRSRERLNQLLGRDADDASAGSTSNEKLLGPSAGSSSGKAISDYNPFR
jgi:hypothetical protein